MSNLPFELVEGPTRSTTTGADGQPHPFWWAEIEVGSTHYWVSHYPGRETDWAIDAEVKPTLVKFRRPIGERPTNRYVMDELADALNRLVAEAEQAEQAEAEKYPNSRKLSDSAERMDAITEFLEWAENEHGLELGQWVEGHEFYPDGRSANSRIMEFLGVDPRALEQERRAMIAELRGEK